LLRFRVNGGAITHPIVDRWDFSAPAELGDGLLDLDAEPETTRSADLGYVHDRRRSFAKGNFDGGFACDGSHLEVRELFGTVRPSDLADPTRSAIEKLAMHPTFRILRHVEGLEQFLFLAAFGGSELDVTFAVDDLRLERQRFLRRTLGRCTAENRGFRFRHVDCHAVSPNDSLDLLQSRSRHGRLGVDLGENGGRDIRQLTSCEVIAMRGEKTDCRLRAIQQAQETLRSHRLFRLGFSHRNLRPSQDLIDRWATVAPSSFRRSHSRFTLLIDGNVSPFD